jgi:hypothetical protein
MDGQADLAAEGQRAVEFPPSDGLANVLLSQIESLLRQELPGLRGIQNPVLRLEGILVPGENSASVAVERRISFGTIDLNAWRKSVSSDETVFGTADASHDSQHQLDSTAPSLVNVSSSPRRSKRKTINSSTASTCTTDTEDHVSYRRKAVGGLRLATHSSNGFGPTPPRSPSPMSSRQLQPDLRSFPKRKKQDPAGSHRLQASTLDKLLAGIWEQLHNHSFLLQGSQWQQALDTHLLGPVLADSVARDFHALNRRCHRVSCAGRMMRSVEVIVQAHWMECFDARVEMLKKECPSLRLGEQRKAVFVEACTDFGWSEKELRNKM